MEGEWEQLAVEHGTAHPNYHGQEWGREGEWEQLAVEHGTAHQCYVRTVRMCTHTYITPVITQLPWTGVGEGRNG
jgi:hypothetical protein